MLYLFIRSCAFSHSIQTYGSLIYLPLSKLAWIPLLHCPFYAASHFSESSLTWMFINALFDSIRRHTLAIFLHPKSAWGCSALQNLVSWPPSRQYHAFATHWRSWNLVALTPKFQTRFSAITLIRPPLSLKPPCYVRYSLQQHALKQIWLEMNRSKLFLTLL